MSSHNILSEELRRIHQELGIGPEMLRHCKLPMHREPAELVETEPDCFGRTQRLIPQALLAWTAMKQAAAEDGVTLQLVSAYRGYNYQSSLIRRKLEAGQVLSAILRVNAAPGFSEHHSGRAIDIGTPDCPPLETGFENTPAYAWLVRHAQDHLFTLSYPRNNNLAIDFEPWHWCFREQGDGEQVGRGIG